MVAGVMVTPRHPAGPVEHGRDQPETRAFVGEPADHLDPSAGLPEGALDEIERSMTLKWQMRAWGTIGNPREENSLARPTFRRATAQGNLRPNVAEKSAARVAATAVDLSPAARHSPVGPKMAQ